MPKSATVKIGPEIDKKLYVKFSKVAKENGVRDALAAGGTLRSAYDRFGVL